MEVSAENSNPVTLAFKPLIRNNAILLTFVLLIVALAISSPEFLSSRNIQMILQQVAVIGIVASAVSFVMIGGNFDLSVGSTVSLTTVLAVGLHDQLGPTLTIIITLAIGLLIGSFNGLLIGMAQLNSLIITLGMMSVLSGFAMIYAGGTFLTINQESWFEQLASSQVFGIQLPVIFFFAIAFLLAVVLKRTVYGRYIYAVGGNSIASEFSGIRQRYIVFSTFVLSGFFAAIAGVIMASRLMSAQSNTGQGLEMDVLTAIVLGGASLVGGKGNVGKTVIGVLILGCLKNGLILLGFPHYYQWVIIAVVIIFAVWMDSALNRGRIN